MHAYLNIDFILISQKNKNRFFKKVGFGFNRTDKYKGALKQRTLLALLCLLIFGKFGRIEWVRGFYE